MKLAISGEIGMDLGIVEVIESRSNSLSLSHLLLLNNFATKTAATKLEFDVYSGILDGSH